MTTLQIRSTLRASALFAGLFTAFHAQATVFEDAYDCLKANAKLVYVTAEVGPKAVELVVTQPQCVALVISPAPVPSGVMVGTLVMTNTGVLPAKNPACENALYSTAGRSVAELMGTVGLKSKEVTELLANQASAAAIGEAVQRIPGASVAFASFTCGCGLSDIGLNRQKVSEIYNAVKATASSCGGIIGNLLEGGSEAVVSLVSNAGDVLSHQSMHMAPAKYYELNFKPRLMADYVKYDSFAALQANLGKTTIPACEHYFDKHTMSAINANKTCEALGADYVEYFVKMGPVINEKNRVSLLQGGGGGQASFNSDKDKPVGAFCGEAAKAAVTANKSKNYTGDYEKYMTTCMKDAGAYFGFELTRNTMYSSKTFFKVKRVSEEHWANRIKAAMKVRGSKNSITVETETVNQLLNEWKPQEAQKRAAWLAEINGKNATADEVKKKEDAAFAEKNKKLTADEKAKAEKAAAEALAKAQAGCKDERCKVETAEWIAACKPYGTESQVMNGQMACGTNLGVSADISVVRADFNAQLDSQVKKHQAVLCPPNMDCMTGINKQRLEIETAANKVWDYGRDQALKRALTSDSRKAVVNEVTQMIAPVKARQIVAANQPKGADVAQLDRNRKDVGQAYKTPPPLVQMQAPPKIESSAPPKGLISGPPKDFKAPPPATINTPPPPITVTTPPPSGKMPGSFGSGAAGSLGSGTSSGGLGGSFPKGGNISGALGASGSTKVEGCEPRGAQDPTTLMCSNEAALNRCRSLIVSGKVKSCVAR